MIRDIENLANDSVKTTMSVDEFNRTIAYRWLTLPKDSEVHIINNHDPDEVFIEVDGKRMWRAKRKYILKEPKKPHVKREHVTSSIDEAVRMLPPPAFKLYYWILSIDKRTFMSQSAQSDLSLSGATILKSLKIVEKAGLIKVLAFTNGVGYTVEIVQ